MTGRIGIEVTPTALHVVELSRWRDVIVRAFDVTWSPDEPEAAVAELRRALGEPTVLSLAVGLGFLRVAKVDLPPAPDDARDGMVALEPERFFATDAPLRTAVAPGASVGFAVARPWMEALTRALASWAPVERIDPSPLAIGESLGAGANGTFAVPVAHGEHGRITVRGGRLESARRIPAAAEDPAGAALSAIHGFDAKYRAAYGAVLRLERSTAGTFLDPTARAAVRSQARARSTIAVVAAAAGLAFMLYAVDRSRDRKLFALEAEAARLTSEAYPALAAQQRLLSMDRERVVIQETMSRRADVGAALAAISATLPEDAVILSAKAAGHQWEIEGTATNAAALVPRLDADPRFDSVRVLSASSRFRDGNRTRESFSLALHVRPAH